jgi:DNA processing protein
MKYLNALYTIPGVGSETLRKLFGRFQEGEAIWKASSGEIIKCGIAESMASRIVQGRAEIDPEAEWEKLQQENVCVISIFDDCYPALLKEIPSPPFLLYYKGNLDCLGLPSIAIVGSRKYSPYGKQVAEKFSYDLARAGLCIVSGLALGIDALAHGGALEDQGKTIAVLGSSLDDANIHPKNNFNLAQEIIRGGGLLLSEFPIPTPPLPGTFPARDRIMAGLTLGTLVVEAAEKSGSLITPSHALEFNREVFAIPGSIYSPQSFGTNNLIKKGAKLVTNISDILEELRLVPSREDQLKLELPDLDEEEKNVLHVLSPQPTHIDRIIKLTKLETSCAASILSMLEIKGAIRNIGGQNYIRL